MQKAHNNKSDNRMIWILMYIILSDKIGELHTESLKIEQKISRCMKVLRSRKSPLCTTKVLPMLLSECLRRNQNKMFLNEPDQNLDVGTPHAIHQYSSDNINTLHVYMHIYPESFIESHIQEFHIIT